LVMLSLKWKWIRMKRTFVFLKREHQLRFLRFVFSSFQCSKTIKCPDVRISLCNHSNNLFDYSYVIFQITFNSIWNHYDMHKSYLKFFSPFWCSRFKVWKTCFSVLFSITIRFLYQIGTFEILIIFLKFFSYHSTRNF